MRLLLLEDDRLLGEGLRDFLCTEGHVVDWCCTVAQARAALRGDPFDAWLLDWQLPDGSGRQLLAELRRGNARTPALMLTARDALADRIDGLDSGADDYLVKPFAPEELAARIRVCLRRLQAEPQGLRLQAQLQVGLAERQVWWKGSAVELTAREWTLLEALCLRAERWVSKSDLDRLVHGFDGEPAASNALEVHVSNLRRKLGRTSIETLRGMGYRVRHER
ncbi:MULTISPECIES: response regulator [unclassified Roseateles]|uniref:response regulator n=1 Tax=unclassified Roseateles TaxID=2626991 RepID=UPI0006F35D34|nr:MULTISPECIES: response regulator [unclassified Roseateles]KQW41272.1 two-component system response regulator [Pelomonas sp. Root405]KRA68043.1 two-component system response regulator [Pelomonas sp. Root662]